MGGSGDTAKAAIGLGFAVGAAAIGAASWAISTAVDSHKQHKRDKKEAKRMKKRDEATQSISAVSPDSYSHIARWLHASRGERYNLEVPRLISHYLQLREKIDDDAHPDVNETKFRKAMGVIERDIERTMPLEKALESTYRRDQLRRILTAYALYDPPVGYVQGMNYLVGFILIVITSYNGPDASRDAELCDGTDLKLSTLHSLVADGIMQEAVAFALLSRLMSHPKYHMRGLFLQDLPDVAIVSYQLNVLMEKHTPEVAHKLKGEGLDSMYFFEWYFTLFTYVLPPDTVAEVWDDFFELGWCTVFRVIMTLLRVLEPALLECSSENPMELVTILKSFQNYCNRGMAIRSASEPQKTKGQLKRELNEANIDTSWEAVSSEESSQGGMMLPPPPDLMTRARTEFKNITVAKIDRLRTAAKDEMESRRIVRAAHQASNMASDINAEEEDTAGESKTEIEHQSSASSWDVVEGGEVDANTANSVWDGIDVVISHIRQQIAHYPVSRE